MVLVEGPLNPSSGGAMGQRGERVCACFPANQNCPKVIPSTDDALTTRIVHEEDVGPCPGEKVCCFIDENFSTVQPPQGCGVQNPIPYRQPGFAEATFGEYPWMAVLLNSADDFKGAGALIAEDWVLTAAHKVYNERNLKVRLGEHDRRFPQDHSTLSHIDVPVSRTIIHPGFNNKSLANDIAVLQLQRSVNTREFPHIGIVCLPAERQLFEAENACWVTGYGKSDFDGGALQDILKEVDLPIVDSTACEIRLRRTKLGEEFILDDSFLCAGGIAGKDACTGDGGAPLVCFSERQGWTVVGLVAWGIGCAQGDVPGVYANVAQLRSFIRDNTGL
ncbi:inactive CLIP domain-containing serine protease A3-like isoform X2 [Panulirus ornatus]